MAEAPEKFDEEEYEPKCLKEPTKPATLCAANADGMYKICKEYSDYIHGGGAAGGGGGDTSKLDAEIADLNIQLTKANEEAAKLRDQLVEKDKTIVKNQEISQK